MKLLKVTATISLYTEQILKIKKSHDRLRGSVFDENARNFQQIAIERNFKNQI